MNNVAVKKKNTNESTFLYWNALIGEAENRLADSTDSQRRKDINRAINTFREFRDKGESFPPGRSLAKIAEDKARAA